MHDDVIRPQQSKFVLLIQLVAQDENPLFCANHPRISAVSEWMTEAMACCCSWDSAIECATESSPGKVK